MVRKLSLYDDTPELTTAELAEMHLVDVALTGFDFGPTGSAARTHSIRPPVEVGKVPVTIRLDADIVATFKATGAGWQSRMNASLREAAVTSPRWNRPGPCCTAQKAKVVSPVLKRAEF